jgi:hypothetical protein
LQDFPQPKPDIPNSLSKGEVHLSSNLTELQLGQGFIMQLDQMAIDFELVVQQAA